jgi:hypothetical protein
MKKSVSFFIIFSFALASFGQEALVNQNAELATLPTQGQQYAYKQSLRAEQLTTTNLSKMAAFLKAINFCDRAANSYGQVSCNSISTSKIDLVFQASADGNSGLVTILANRNMLDNNVLFLTESNGVFIPDPKNYNQNVSNVMQLKMPIWPINKFAGFEARSYTGLSTQNLISIQVLSGKITDSSVEFNLLFKGEKIAEGSMVGCSTLNCGL